MISRGLLYRRGRTVAALSALALAAGVMIPPHFGSAQTAGAWPTFHGSATRSGLSANAGPTANTATNEWTLAGGKAIESSPAVDANGTAYVGADDNYVYALNPSNPTGPVWKFKTNGPVISSPTLSSDGKTLFVGSNDGSVYAIDTSSGKQVWATDVAGAVHASPLLSNDGSTLYIVNANGDISALKATDGSMVWPKAIYSGAPVTGSLALSPDGSTLYVAGTSGYMYAIPTSGQGTANITAFYLDGEAISTPSVDGNGNIYVTTTKGALESFAPGQVAPRWEYVIPAHTAAVSTPAIGNGIVVFGDNDGSLYDLNPSSGQPVWNAFPHTGGSIRTSPAISSNGLIYFGSDDGNIYALSASTGGVIWQKGIGVPISSSPAIGPGGSMWIGSDDGVVYRFSAIAPPGQPSPGAATSSAVTTTTATSASPTPSGTATGAPSMSLRPTVKDGQKQVVTVTGLPAGTTVHFRVQYPNGDHQSHGGLADSAGKVTYSYTQGSSKMKHNRFVATVTVKLGTSSSAAATAQYRILFGKVDASVEPRTAKPSHIVNVYVHTTVSKRAVAYLLFPSGKFVTLSGKTGPHGFIHIRYKVPRGTTRGTNHRVKVLGATLAHRPKYTTQTYFTIG